MHEIRYKGLSVEDWRMADETSNLSFRYASENNGTAHTPSSVGTRLTQVAITFSVYIGGDYYIYKDSTGSEQVYLKRFSDTWSSTGSTLLSSGYNGIEKPIVSSNYGEIVYRLTSGAGDWYMMNPFGGVNQRTQILSGTTDSGKGIYVGNSEIVISSGNRLYRKFTRDNSLSLGTQITTQDSFGYTYVPGGYIAYIGPGANYHIWLKSLYDNSNGTEIGSDVCSTMAPIIFTEEGLVYANFNNYLCRLNVFNYSGGVPFTSMISKYPISIGNGEILYTWTTTNDIYRTRVTSNLGGALYTQIMYGGTAGYTTYLGDGNILYRNTSDGMLYRKRLW